MTVIESETLLIAQAAGAAFVGAADGEQGGGGMRGHCRTRLVGKCGEIVEAIFEDIAGKGGARVEKGQVLGAGDSRDDARG